MRAVILTGSGGNFSAGGDISEFATVRATVEAGTFYEHAEEDALLAVLHCGKPTIAEISGFAIGGACALALACDFRVADCGASFFIPAGRLRHCLQQARERAASAPGWPHQCQAWSSSPASA